MIWNSILAMTAIDLFVIVTITALSIAVLRLRSNTLPQLRDRGTTFVLFGLAINALFYLADLLTLHVLPLFVEPARAMAVLTALHLEADMIVSATSLPLIGAGFMLDILSRRNAAAAVKASETRLRSIVQDQPDFIVRWLRNGIRTWVNEPYCRTFATTADKAVGTSFFPLLNPDVAARLEKQMFSVQPDSPIRSGVYEVSLPDGSKGWQEWTNRALFDKAGQVTEIQSVGRDITDRVLTEKALQDSEARFRGFVENTHDWVWQTNASTHCVYSNSQSLRILGYAPEEVIERYFGDLIHPEDREQTVSRLGELSAEKRGWQRWLVRYIHRNGSIRYLESSADPVFNEAGEVVGYRGISRDRTFETLLQLLSSDLVGCTAAEVDGEIERSLERIGLSYDLDRFSFWWFDENSASSSHEWSRGDARAPLRHLSTTDHVPLGHAILKKNETYKVESVKDLPPDSKDRAFLETQNVKSTMALPLYDGDRVVGAAVCSMLRTERTWPQDMEDEIHLLADKIAAAHRQAEATSSVIRRERDLARAEELAQVGSYAFYRTSSSGDFPAGWQTHFSREFCTLLEAEPQQASYELLLSRVHPEDRRAFDAFLVALLASGHAEDRPYRVVNPSGRVIHFAGRAELEFDHHGNIARIVGSNRDITDQVEREQELVRALDENEKLRERLQEENIQLREEIRSITEFEQIIGDSPTLRASLDLAAKAAPTDAAVLVLGETGTGKELVARAIHALSARHDKRLVSVNCTALPASLVESELFGHEKGAFTGATNRRAGRFEIAEGGTLFLDEIGDLPLDLQAKLLRVLEDGSFERVGGSATLHADVRLIAATNRDLEAAVRAGEFRADLFYRISTVPIELPPLRERREDIPSLAHHFVAKHNARLGKSVNAISTRMLEYLQKQDWPGNIRELEHFVERSLISATGSTLTLGEQFFQTTTAPGAAKAAKSAQLRSVERDHIMQVLEDTGWVIDGSRGAAAALGLAPSTLRSKMKRLGIARRA